MDRERASGSGADGSEDAALSGAVARAGAAEEAEHIVHAGFHHHAFDLADTFDESDPRIRSDVITIVYDYLQRAGLTASATTLRDEAQVVVARHDTLMTRFSDLRSAVVAGDWKSAHKLVQDLFSRRYKETCTYLLLAEEYLELVAARDVQRAFDLLNQRLKPLEAVGEAHAPGHFHDLCYLLSCKSVQDAPSFKDWPGRSEGRGQLADRLDALWRLESRQQGGLAPLAHSMPSGRLLTLLRQAVARQIESSRYHPRLPPTVGTLLRDYRCAVVPNAALGLFAGHLDNVKAVAFAGHDRLFLASGSSDNTVRLWPADRAVWCAPLTAGPADAGARADAAGGGREADGGARAGASLRPRYEDSAHVALRGHTSRVWDVAAPPRGTAVASAGGDGAVRVWQAGAAMDALKAAAGAPVRAAEPSSAEACRAELRRADGKLVGWLPAARADLGPAQAAADAAPCGALPGHSGDVYSVSWLPQGRHLVSAGYDRTVRLWDAERAEAVFRGHSASVSHAIANAHGSLLVSASKDGSVRYWDVLSGMCVATVGQAMGEVTCARLSHCGTRLLTASKDNAIRLWDVRTGKQFQKLRGHQNTSRNFVRCSFGPGSLVLSGSEDGRVCVWDADQGVLLQRLRGHRSCVYRAEWCDRQSLVASCGHDGTVRTWWFDPSAPLDVDVPE